MKIGVVSDTHSWELPAAMLEAFKAVDLIIHAGDFCSLDVVKKLQNIKVLKAVHGNMDGPEIRKLFPRSQLIPCGDFTLGLFHGEGPRWGIEEAVKKEFAGKAVDAIIFGHSHVAMNAVREGILYFNPGSPNDKSAASCSYGILTVEKKISGRIIKLS